MIELARPPSKSLRELPVVSVESFQDVGLLRQALVQHELGYFQSSASLLDLMGRDDRITGLLSQRFNGLLGLPFDFDGKDEEASKPFVEALEDNGEWIRMAPRETIFELLRWGYGIGFGLAEKVWDLGDRWIPSLKVWHPRFVQYRWETQSFWVTTMDGPVEVAEGNRWVIFTPYGKERGWMGGLIRSLALPWIIRQFTYRDWARYGEVHGLPIKKAIVPPEAGKKEKEEFARDLVRLASESLIVLPQGEDGDKFDVQLLEAVALGHETFDKLISKCESSLAIAVVGQNLTSEVKGGSYAAAQVHQNVRADIIRSDADAICKTLKRQLLDEWALYNHESTDDVPAPCFDTDPPEDLTAKSTTVSNVASAIASFHSSGAPVDFRKLLEDFNIPVDENAPDMVAAEPQDPEGENIPGDPKGADPIDGKEPKPKKKLTALDRKAHGAVRGQVYTDTIGDEARAAAAGALKPDLKHLVELIDGADSYEALRQKVLSAYKHRMTPDALAKVQEQAAILADLNGRYAVLEDT